MENMLCLGAKREVEHYKLYFDKLFHTIFIKAFHDENAG